MEAVDDDRGIWEALLGYAVHGVAEIHRDFLHLSSLGFWRHHENP